MTTLVFNSLLVLIVLSLAACVSKERLSSASGLSGSPGELPGMTAPVIEQDTMGDEMIKRKLIRRANVAALAIKEGTLAVRICIDRSGKVISSTFIPEKSMKSNRALITKVEEVARQYVFEANPDAPPEQCGNLTFVFKHPR